MPVLSRRSQDLSRMALMLNVIIVLNLMYMCYHPTTCTVFESLSREVRRWDRERETAEQYVDRFCGRVCNGTTTIEDDISERCGVCFPCSCDQRCELDGTCCPQVGSDLTPPPTHRSSCVNAREISVVAVTSCDPLFSDGNTRLLCETRPPILRRRDTLLLVTSTRSNVTYSNIHCAACNHDNESVVIWDMSVRCKHNQFLYNVTTDQQYDDRALQLKEVCDITMELSDGLLSRVHLCRYEFLDENVVSQCNVTGLWQEGDLEVRALCNRESPLTARVYVFFNGLYSNLFCAMCNVPAKDLHNRKPTCFFPHHASPQVKPVYRGTWSLSGTRGFDSAVFTGIQGKDAPNNCTSRQWLHPRGQCDELQCFVGKTLTDGRCEAAVKRVVGLGYHLNLLLRLTNIRRSAGQTASLSDVTPKHMTSSAYPPFTTSTYPGNTEYVTYTSIVYYDGSPLVTPGTTGREPCGYAYVLRDKLVKLLDYFAQDVAVDITTQRPQTGDCDLESLKILLEELANRGRWSSDDGDSDDDYSGQWMSLTDDLTGEEATMFTAIVEADLLENSFGRDELENCLNRLLSDWEVKVGDWLLTLSPTDLGSGFHVDKEQVTSHEMNGADWQVTYIPYTSPSPRPPAGLESTFLPFGKRLTCPYVDFERDEFQIIMVDRSKQVQFPYYVDQKKQPVKFDVSTEHGAWLSAQGHLMICKESLSAIFPENVTVALPDGRSFSQVLQVMGVVCGSVSVVFLLVTFITYCLFSELRCLPGLHNMGLSITLASAQLTLVVPWHRTENTVMCRAVGVVTHWAWLSALCWMGVCCTHMVRVFTASSRRVLSPHETLRAFLRGLLITLAIPTLVVAVTIGATAALSGGEHLGYGGVLCFLETKLHVGLAFLLPLLLLIVLNITCFIFTVISIMRVRRLQTQTKRDRSDILVYAKLATVTGGTWMLGLLAEATDQDWLRVLAELCTASQGLLLFLAYVCNARVLRLCRERLGCPGQETWAGSTSQTTATTRVSGNASQHTAESATEKNT